MHHVIAQKIHGVAFFIPGRSVLFMEGRFERFIRALANKVALHFSDVRRIAGVPQFFIKDPQKNLEDHVTLGFAISLGIDVEQDDVRAALGCALHVGQQ